MEKKKDTIITLKVNTQKIHGDRISKYVKLSDNRTDDPKPEPKDPADFVSLVNRNMKVFWFGAPEVMETGDSVQITGILRKTSKGNAEILENKYSDPEKDGVYVAKVKDKDIEGDEAYSIIFKINNDAKREYTLDPKLRMDIIN